MVRFLVAGKDVTQPAVTGGAPGSVRCLSIAGGEHWAVVTPPPGVVAAGTTTSSLEVSVLFASDTESAALSWTARKRTATVFLKDDGPTMTGAKKIAADHAFLIYSDLMLDDDLPALGFVGDPHPLSSFPFVTCANLFNCGGTGTANGTLGSQRAAFQLGLLGGGVDEVRAVREALFMAASMHADAFDSTFPPDGSAALAPEEQSILLVTDTTQFDIVPSPDALPNASSNPLDYFTTTEPTDAEKALGHHRWYSGVKPIAWGRRMQPFVDPPPLRPRVDVVALGQAGALGAAAASALQELPRVTAGRYVYVPVFGNESDSQARLLTGDALADLVDRRTARERSFSLVAPSLLAAPSFSVEGGAQELAVLVSSPGTPELLFLLGPGGQAELPELDPLGNARFIVPSPQAGAWRVFSSRQPTGTEPEFLVTASVQGAVRTFARAAPRALVEGPGGTHTGQSGDPVALTLALAVGSQPATGATAFAAVEFPSGFVGILPLLDDGRHGDGASGDGVYGFPLRNTFLAGAYRVRFVADGQSAVTGPFHREVLESFHLIAAPDLDEDLLPDPWEARNGLDPTVNDAFGDPDGDGLVNALELVFGTDPMNGDTDGGGEADGSEIARLANPFDPSDDATRPGAFTVLPSNGKVHVFLLPAPAGQFTVVERADGPEGPFAAVTTTAGGSFDDVALENGTRVCYRARAVRPSELGEEGDATSEQMCAAVTRSVASVETMLDVLMVTSAWTATECVVPKEDPLPPILTARLRDAPSNVTRTRYVTLALSAVDNAEDTDVLDDTQADPDVVVSAVTELRVGLAPALTDAAWEPFQAERAVLVPDADQSRIYVQVRDAAGNVSPLVSVSVAVVAKTSLDRAIRLEERALDRLDAGDTVDASRAILDSLGEVAQSVSRAKQAVAHSHGHAVRDRALLLAQLAHVAAKKLQSVALLHAGKVAKARGRLVEALELERDAATRATEMGVGL